MLATVGIVVQEFIHLPGSVFAESNPLSAIYAVPFEGWVQILMLISLIELATFKTNFSSEPSNFGFDPLKLGGNGKWKVAEVVNARLAMLGAIGFIAQTINTGKPVVAQLTSFAS